MDGFYFLSNNQDLRTKLIDNGYSEYQGTKQQIHDEIRRFQTDTGKKFCRDEKNIDTEYLLANLLDFGTTNIVLFRGNLLCGLLNFSVTNQNGKTILTGNGICVPDTDVTGIGTLFLSHLKAIAKVLGASQIRMFADDGVVGFYKKNGFIQESRYDFIFDIVGGARSARKAVTRKRKKRRRLRKFCLGCSRKRA
jgi:hypothetical protein